MAEQAIDPAPRRDESGPPPASGAPAVRAGARPGLGVGGQGRGPAGACPAAPAGPPAGGARRLPSAGPAPAAVEAFLPGHRLLDDAALLAPPAAPLTPLTLFVCTYVARLEGVRARYEAAALCGRGPGAANAASAAASPGAEAADAARGPAAGADAARGPAADGPPPAADGPRPAPEARFEDFARLFRPQWPVAALNSNYGHLALPGYEGHLKLASAARPARPARPALPARGRARKVQGDGTCFNSAIEPVVPLAALSADGGAAARLAFGAGRRGDGAWADAGKVYYMKCFPTTGETQVPGVIGADLSDGRAVLEAFVAYLNAFAPPGVAVAAAPVAVLSEGANMLNYKFRLARASPRLLVNLGALAALLRGLAAADGPPRGPAAPPALPAVAAPYPVREVKRAPDDVKVSFRMRADAGTPRVNVFQEGKINILGAKSVEAARRIWAFLAALFAAHWARLVCLQPRRDAERALAARQLELKLPSVLSEASLRAAAAAPPPAAPLTPPAAAAAPAELARPPAPDAGPAAPPAGWELAARRAARADGVAALLAELLGEPAAE